MLPRQLEPEVMDSVEEARDYDAMDHSEVNRVFVAHFLKSWNGNNPILDVGAGTGQIPIELCRTDRHAQITAIDLATEMLKVAAENVGKAGFDQRIKLELVDAKAMPYADGAFAAVISNSIIHHIPDPAAVISEVVRVCRRGGLVFVRDLMRPDSQSQLQQLVQQYAGGASAHQQQMFAESLHAALTLEEIQALIVARGFAAETVRATSDRHWTWVANS